LVKVDRSYWLIVDERQRVDWWRIVVIWVIGRKVIDSKIRTREGVCVNYRGAGVRQYTTTGRKMPKGAPRCVNNIRQ
jgi:hypothetical protein